MILYKSSKNIHFILADLTRTIADAEITKCLSKFEIVSSKGSGT